MSIIIVAHLALSCPARSRWSRQQGAFLFNRPEPHSGRGSSCRAPFCFGDAGTPPLAGSDKFFEHFTGTDRIKGGTAMTTYYYPSDTFFGGAITVGPADEIVDFHGSGVSVDLFGTAISSTLLDGFETVESGGLDSGSTIDVELNVMSGGTVIGATIDTFVYRLAGEAIGVTLESGTVETISSGGVAGERVCCVKRRPRRHAHYLRAVVVDRDRRRETRVAM